MMASSMGSATPSDSWSFVEAEEHDFILIIHRSKSKERYPAKLHARNVARHLGQEEGLIYLPGLPETSYEDSDQPIHFRQLRYFFYMSGINFPGCAVTYDIHRDQLLSWIPPPNTGLSVVFNGSYPTSEEIYQGHDFDGVSHIGALNHYLSAFSRREEGQIYVLHSCQIPATIFNIDDKHDWGPIVPAYDAVLLKPAMDASRVEKSPYEIEMIRQANRITAKAYKNVLRSIRYLENEAEIEGIFAATCISHQAKEQAYKIIAASGENASTLHYVANNESLKGRQLLCLDAGCEWNLYASDVTRTFPLSGKFTEEGQNVYALVERMQEECIIMVKPGVNYWDIHMHAHEIALEGLIELGLLRGAFDELYAIGASKIFFPHGLGHYLGLECHDVGDGGNLLLVGAKEHLCDMGFGNAAASILRPNMVITIEPGIYFSRYAIEDVYLKDERYANNINKHFLDKYYPVGGIRIEDDILVTDDGYENLTTAPKREDALRIINEGNGTLTSKMRGLFQ